MTSSPTQCGDTEVHPPHGDCPGLDGSEPTRTLLTSRASGSVEARVQEWAQAMVDSGEAATLADAVAILQRALNTPVEPLAATGPHPPPTGPIDVRCPSCGAPPKTPCYTSGAHGGQITHSDRQDSARLRSVEHGTCALCGQPLVRGVRYEGAEVDAWHPDAVHAAACPPMPDPSASWNAYAAAVNRGVVPGHPGLENFTPAGAWRCAHGTILGPEPGPCGCYNPETDPSPMVQEYLAARARNAEVAVWDPEDTTPTVLCRHNGGTEDCPPVCLLMYGERVTSGSDPNPVVCPECVAGKHQNCTGQALHPVTDELVDCTCDHAPPPPEH